MAKKETRKAVDLNTWQRLYELAEEIKAVAPWEWVSESEFFGVQDPVTGELGFISIMGMSGEHFAIATYLGAEGLYGYWYMADPSTDANPEEILEVPQLQLSFEDRIMLTDKDRSYIKDTGFKFRGRNSWPKFRSYKPGFYPWYLDPGEAQFLIHILEQTLDVLPRYQKDETLLKPPTETSYLVRTSQSTENGLQWRDEFLEIPRPELEPVEITIDGPIIEAFLSLEQAVRSIDADVFMFPGQIQENSGERPYYAYMLMIVEPKTGMIIGSELLSPFPTLESMWGKIPEAICKVMIKVNLYPNEIRISSPRLYMILEPVAEDIGFSITLTDALPSLEGAKGALLGRFI
ncbi:MAG: hypothetical protein WAM60_22080 [Candidatus Promineifilaceae bacterium]